mmetsp:Transcript_6163/g.8959  ORF Transcript_6163/g.8959 Transcript_6163/m.8959 type:complete len:89 (-) Transcript_6163:561-827(-)
MNYQPMSDIEDIKDEINVFLAIAAADDELIACLQRMDDKMNDLTRKVNQLNINNTALKWEITILREHINPCNPNTTLHNLTKDNNIHP